jgi:chromosome partitioning protein
MSITTEENYLDVKEIAVQLGIDESNVRRRISNNILPALKKNTKSYISTNRALEYYHFTATHEKRLKNVKREAKTITIANNKGGCAKTTTATNLAGLLSKLGNRVLLIDYDQQSNASMMAIEPIIDENGMIQPFDLTIKDILLEQKKNHKVSLAFLQRAIRPSLWEFDVIPCDISLNSVRQELESASAKEMLLKEALKSVESLYDYIIIDTPPSLALEQTTSFFASDYVLIVSNPATFSVMGIEQTVSLIRSAQEQNILYAKPKKIEILGVIIASAEMRTNVTKHYVQEIKTFCQAQDVDLFKEIVSKNIKVVESHALSKMIYEYDASSDTSLAYFDIAMSLDMRLKAKALGKAS